MTCFSVLQYLSLIYTVGNGITANDKSTRYIQSCLWFDYTILPDKLITQC